MHPIRRQILSNLILARELPFSKLKPQDIESNIFMYHLKLLISEGLVRKLENKKYSLTNEGVRLASGLSWKSLSTRIQPRIVTMIICKNKDGEHLLYKSKRQPTLNLVSFPYGKLHLGEKVLEAGDRELEEKAGLTARLFHRGDIYVTAWDGSDILVQMLVHVFLASNSHGEIGKGEETGECFWGRPEKISKEEKTPWFDDIYKLFKNPPRGFFFREFTYRI